MVCLICTANLKKIIESAMRFPNFLYLWAIIP